MLFRREASAHASAPRYGEIILTHHPVSHTVMTVVFVAIGAAIVLFFGLFSYTKKVDVSGVLLPVAGLTRVVDSQSGIVVERTVSDGMRVKAGDVLFVIKSDRASLSEGDAEKAVSELLTQRLASLQAEQTQLESQARNKVRAAERKVDNLKGMLPLLEEQIALQKQKLAIAADEYQRFHELEHSHFVSGRDVQQKQSDLLEQRLHLSDLNHAYRSAEQDLAVAVADLREQEIQALRNQEEGQRSIAAVRQDLTENEARREIRILAPQDGVAGAVTVDVGQAVSAGETLVVLLPQNSELEADLYAPSKAVGFLKPGMSVRLRYDAYSYQKFGLAYGVVRDVARTAVRPEDINPLAELGRAPMDSKPIYKVRVALDRQTINAYGSEIPLRAGSAVEASVLLERRRLIEWVLEPLYSLSGHI